MNAQRNRPLMLGLGVVPLVAAVALVGCESRMGRMMGGGSSAMQAQMMMPEPTAESVQKHLQSQRYQSWRLFPGKGALYKGQEPHGMLLTTYVNEAAFNALNAKANSLPYGAILVKENYTPDRKLAAVTTMYKSKGYNPGSGDWFWMKTSADGKVEASGKVGGCIGCHTPSKRDFVLTPLS